MSSFEATWVEEQRWLQLKNKITAKTAIFDLAGAGITKRVVHDSSLLDQVIARLVSLRTHRDSQT